MTDAVDGFLREVSHLIVDRDPLYTEHFRSILKSTGVELLRLPARSPNLNAYAERFVRSIKSECLSHIVPLGDAIFHKSFASRSNIIITSETLRASRM